MSGGTKVTIITSVTDGYDTLKRQTEQVGIDAEWIAVTDGTEVAEEGHPWEIINVEHWATEKDVSHPNRLAKIAKTQPWLFGAEASHSIWIDASYRITSPVFAFQTIPMATPVAQFLHPWRQCIYREAVASLELPRYLEERDRISAQVNEYEEIGHPANWGLWATGVIIRKHTDDVIDMSLMWLNEIRRWSYQDQLSEPVALRLCDLRPQALPGDHINNPWLKYEGSARH